MGRDIFGPCILFYFNFLGHKDKKKTGIPAPVSLVTEGVFYRTVFVESEGEHFEYNFAKGHGKISSKYFKITSTSGASRNRGEKCKRKFSVVVEFTHSQYSKIVLKLSHFSNPQLKYGASVELPIVDGLSGLFIRESKCSGMRCRLRNTRILRTKPGKNRSMSTILLK